MPQVHFPENFIWGTATAAYQIEGGYNAEGKGLSVWDVFSHTPGKIVDRSDGDQACDHYHRYPEDFALMKSLGYPAYRFSISWPRLLPEGRKRINQAGIDFYNRLIDKMLENGVTPYLTLFHWDLPITLHQQGGWYSRDTAYAFAEYADLVVRSFGDRVKHFMTLNEPSVVFSNGHIMGEHAPGFKNKFKAFKVAHHLLLAHGLGMQAIRAADSSIQAGIVNALWPVYPDRKQDEPTVKKAQNFSRLFMDPVLLGRYPELFRNLIPLFTPGYRDEDLKIISEPTDFIGINQYSRAVIRKALNPMHPFKNVKPQYPGVEFTEMDWEVYPEGLYDLLGFIRKEYNNPKVLITENGAAYPDVRENGAVHDPKRIAYLKRYLEQLARAVSDGSDIGGYFVWSFMDNFEWAYGYTKRFGLIYVDYETKERIVKDSGRWYSETVRNNGFDL